MANLSEFFSGGGSGGSLTNTYSAFAVMENTPGWNSSNNTYTDENGGVWLRSGSTLDATSAAKLSYPNAGFKNYAYGSLGAPNPAVNRQFRNNWGIVHSWNDENNVTGFKVYGQMRYTYNSTYGWMDFPDTKPTKP